MQHGSATFPRTKFHRPARRDEHVERTDLLLRLRASREQIVVVSGPPGYGKSTLVSQWITREHDAERTVWVSLDPEDVGTRFWAAVLSGLEPVLGERVQEALDGAAAPDADLRDQVLVPLLDALAEDDEPILIVLDDVHLIRDVGTLESLDWALARLPHAHRLVLISRTDPPLASLNRLKVRGDVLDVRADELRFGLDETRRFLVDHLGIAVDEAQLAALDSVVGGWPAALYLASLRLSRGEAVDAVLLQLRGRTDELIGALTDELLASQEEDERRFTLESAVLDRFDLDLCVRVLGREAETSRAFHRTVRSSLLVVPLDAERRWFRYHHLFGDVLYDRLVERDPVRVRELHRRAGTWFETEGGEGELVEAMGHFMAADAWESVAALLQLHGFRFALSGPLGGRARHWLERIPEGVVRRDARLCFLAALLAGLDGIGEDTQRWLDAGDDAGWEGPMPDGTPSWPLAALALRGTLCFADLGATIADADAALAVLPAGGAVQATLQSLTAWHLLVAGRVADAEDMARATIEGHETRLAGTVPLVGFLPAAVLALAALERGDLDVGRLLVQRAVERRDAGPLRVAPHALPVACAEVRLHVAEGDLDAAIDIAAEALETAAGWQGASLMVPALQLELARAHVAAGEPDAARAVVAEARVRLLDVRDAGVVGDALQAVQDGLQAPPPRRTGAGATPQLRDVDGVDELSHRELDVLRALSGSGSLREIADGMFLSYNTIKTHARTLYAKLGAASREEAVRKGYALGLLGSGAER